MLLYQRIAIPHYVPERYVPERYPKKLAATHDDATVFRHYGFAAPPVVYRRVACPMFVSSIPIGRRYRLRPGHPSLGSPSIAGSAIAPGRGRQMTANQKILLYVHWSRSQGWPLEAVGAQWCSGCQQFRFRRLALCRLQVRTRPGVKSTRSRAPRFLVRSVSSVQSKSFPGLQ